jgi:hypothetical protein
MKAEGSLPCSQFRGPVLHVVRSWFLYSEELLARRPTPKMDIYKNHVWQISMWTSDTAN